MAVSSHPPSARTMGYVNWMGLWTLLKREVGRFMNVGIQTVAAPAVTTLLFYAIFALAIGTDRPQSFLAFLAPGLIMMAIAQNAFSNSSSSLMIAKMQGNIIDVIIAPLSPAELCVGYVAGTVVRGFVVGVICIVVLMPFAPMIPMHVGLVILFMVLGSVMMGALGLIAGLWAEKYDHIAAVTNFIVTPLTFLSGTFYELHRLPSFWQDVALSNPFFYMIDGFRAGFTGTAEGSLVFGVVYLTVVSFLLCILAWVLIRSGYKLRP